MSAYNRRIHQGEEWGALEDCGVTTRDKLTRQRVLPHSVVLPRSLTFEPPETTFPNLIRIPQAPTHSRETRILGRTYEVIPTICLPYNAL